MTMEPEEYRLWRGRLDQWLGQRPPEPVPGDDDLESRLAAVLARARRVIEGINATREDVRVDDRNKYDFLLSRLAELLLFDEFSLAEYTYHLPGDRRPGIRLQARKGGAGTGVAVLWFEDVGRWRTDAEGRKIAAELVTLEMLGGLIQFRTPPGAAELFAPAKDWSTALTEALCLPLLLSD
jgi:hypothetical protein